MKQAASADSPSPRDRRMSSFTETLPGWAKPGRLVQGPAGVDRLQQRIDRAKERAETLPAARWALGIFAAESPLWVLGLLIVPFAAVFITLTVGKWFTGAPFVDFDYWWHLATGNWILDHHRVPT